MACCVSMKYESGRNGGTRMRAELRGDDGSDVSVSAGRRYYRLALLRLHSLSRHSAPADSHDGCRRWRCRWRYRGVMMTVIMVMPLFFVLLVPWSQTPSPIHHTSPPPLLPWPLQVHHHNCQGDLICPHYVHIIRHACSHI